PTETKVLRLLQTTLLTNVSSSEVFGVALLGDVPIITLDSANWSIHFHWPWVQKASSEGDMEKILSQYKIALRNLIRYLIEMAQDVQLDYPLVIQIRSGCELHPNGTSWGFVHIGKDGRDFTAFNLEKLRWDPQETSLIAEVISKSLTKQKGVTGLLEHLLSITCKSYILTLCRYGTAVLERKEPPMPTVFTHMPSSGQLLLVCHVTGFYPRPISVVWLRDGQEVPPGPALNTSPILPNTDLTYQLRSILSVTPHDGHSYACRVRHRSLGTRSILIPWENPSRTPTVAIAIAVLLLMATASAGGAWWWKHR
ncbi:CD1A protein, partial [Upupa epops]|nr:CD1A protein [Upupa epops]